MLPSGLRLLVQGGGEEENTTSATITCQPNAQGEKWEGKWGEGSHAGKCLKNKKKSGKDA